MAFTVQDVQDLLRILREHPEWRDAVRREVLTEQLLGLPEVVRRLADGQVQLTERIDQLAERTGQLAERTGQLAERMDELTVRMDQLTVRMDQLAERMGQLAVRMDQLTERVDRLAVIVERLDGRVGHLEGWRYQQKFHARARVMAILRRPVPVEMADLDVLADAREDGRLSEQDWKQLMALDVFFRGRAGKAPGAPERFVALEVSQVVDSRDVQRAHDRAQILIRLGLETIPAVGGSRLTRDAAEVADRLGVRIVLAAVDDDRWA